MLYSAIIYLYHYPHHPGPLDPSIGRRILGIMTNAGKPNPAEMLSYISQALMVAHPEQFPNSVVLIGETISLFFSQLNLVGIFYPPFFVLNYLLSRARGLLAYQPSSVRGTIHDLHELSTFLLFFSHLEL